MMNHFVRSMQERTQNVRGFALLVAIILTSVILTISLALLDIAYKQVVLSSTGRQSQYAFYAADSAMECALYWDQKQNAFAYSVTPPSTISCAGKTISVTSSVSAGVRTSTFNMPCPTTGNDAIVRIYKTNGSICNSGTATSCLYSTGFNSCNASDTRRIERGLKVFY